MLVWVGADVAGDAFVVWEAEAGATAPDPIAALESGQETGSVLGGDLARPVPQCQLLVPLGL